MTNKIISSTPDSHPGRCTLCPRLCGADRSRSRGFCGAGEAMEISKIMLHHWEEPPISGPDPLDEGHGSGAVFFAHCPLGCIYCQNRKISRWESYGEVYTPDQLAEAMLRLERDGAYNINLVTPTQYTDGIMTAVRIARAAGLTVPIVWNTGGYERAETIDTLSNAGTVDVWLTDFKYASPDLAAQLSGAKDYPEIAAEALCRMVTASPSCVFDEDGMMRQGVIVRHLVLPGHRDDSIAVLRLVASLVDAASIRLSLMAQYTPDFLPDADLAKDSYRSIRRRVTTYEYECVAEEARQLGFEGWMQERSSATKRFTPDF